MRLGGVGIGLRRAFFDDIATISRRLDWLEVIPENYVGVGGLPRKVLRACASQRPVVAHGVSMSLGGPDPLDGAFIDALRGLLDEIDAPFFSEHVCWSSSGGRSSHDLLPLPFTEEAARYVARRARELSERLERPLLLENISYYARMPTSVLSEGDFLRIVLEESGAFLLLDVNNVCVNAKNHGVAPLEALTQLPLERTRQIHLASHSRHGDVWLDDHSGVVPHDVMRLYVEALRRVGPVPTLLEWDKAIPSLEVVLDEADRIRAVLDAATTTVEVARP